MPDSLRVDKARGIAEIRSHGTVSRYDIAASMAKVKSVAAEEAIRLVLVDVTEQKSMPSTMEVFDLIPTFPTDIAFALVSAEQPTAKDIRFIETIVVSRGILIRLFGNRSDAEAWLFGERGHGLSEGGT